MQARHGWIMANLLYMHMAAKADRMTLVRDECIIVHRQRACHKSQRGTIKPRAKTRGTCGAVRTQRKQRKNCRSGRHRIIQQGGPHNCCKFSVAADAHKGPGVAVNGAGAAIVIAYHVNSKLAYSTRVISVNAADICRRDPDKGTNALCPCCFSKVRSSSKL